MGHAQTSQSDHHWQYFAMLLVNVGKISYATALMISKILARNIITDSVAKFRGISCRPSGGILINKNVRVTGIVPSFHGVEVGVGFQVCTPYVKVGGTL